MVTTMEVHDPATHEWSTRTKVVTASVALVVAFGLGALNASKVGLGPDTSRHVPGVCHNLSWYAAQMVTNARNGSSSAVLQADLDRLAASGPACDQKMYDRYLRTHQ